jgi:xanthine dehydrogenase YagR molybdenum-binding subunit
VTAPSGRPAVGTARPRTEGPDKVTGAARYAVEYPAGEVAYAWPVGSPVARGTVRSVDTDAVLGLPGVLAVLWHGNAPRLGEVPDGELLLFQSDAIAYRGQFVAAVVADSLEAARYAADHAPVEIDEQPHDTELRADRPDLYTPDKVNPGYESDTEQGDVDGELAASAVTVDVTYETAALHNNPMEPHASTAQWQGDRLLVHDANQGSTGVARALATLFGIGDGQVQVVSAHVGGGFGAKGTARPNVVLAAMAARVTGRPVRLALSRQHQFTVVGYRTPTIQRIRLGADPDGAMRAISHEVVEQTSTVREFAEQTAVGTRMMYAAAARRTAHKLARLDVPTPAWMRAPGEAPGMYALESAMDELAVACGLDPIELRIRNEPALDPESGNPFSSRNLVACLRDGAARFGWAARDPRPSVRRDGRWWVGTGVAAATYPARTRPSAAAARILRDGRYRIDVNATDIGTGARTALDQVAADALGVSPDRIEMHIGDSTLPPAVLAGGSMGTASWSWAVDKAARQLRELVAAGVPEGGLEVRVDTEEEVAAQDRKWSRHAFGAHFAEVRVDADTGEVRVSRLLGVYAAGRIVNPTTARSQLLGGMTMGLGMALTEESTMDHRFGDYVNDDFAGYHVPACADVGTALEAYWLDEQDPQVNPLGIKGIGEIGIVGVPAAIGNAVWHATGVRVRDLPIRLDKVLFR